MGKLGLADKYERVVQECKDCVTAVGSAASVTGGFTVNRRRIDFDPISVRHCDGQADGQGTVDHAVC